MIREDILVCGGDAHQCDCCGEVDGRPTLYWKEQDFDLCHECLSDLYFKYVCESQKQGEKIIVKRRNVPEKLREKIFERDGRCCVDCGSMEGIQLDHIVPFSKGGSTHELNLKTLCRVCNQKKKDSV